MRRLFAYTLFVLIGKLCSIQYIDFNLDKQGASNDDSPPVTSIHP